MTLENDHWHLDKKVPISLILLIVMQGAVCANVVEQEDAPGVAGEWREVTGLAVGPGQTWTGTAWAVSPSTQPRHITQFAYWSRWPTAKRQAFKLAARTEIAFEDFLDMVRDGKYVDLDLPALRAAHGQIVAAGMLTQAESDAVLDTPVQDSERP